MTLIYTEEHNIFRDTVERFIATEIAPYHREWEAKGIVDRELWRKAGQQGLLLTAAPTEYGGGGSDFLSVIIMLEELAKGVHSGPGFRLHSDVVAPYIIQYGSEDQKLRWLPKMASGDLVAAIAMTEPSAGSDLQAIRTTAIRDGDVYVINGQKALISNGSMADLVIVAVKTDPEARSRGISLIVVEADRPGFEKGQKLEKIGMKAQDTSELFFQDVRVPVTNLLGQEGHGFSYLMRELPRERLIVAAVAQVTAEMAFQWAAEYAKSRQVFGEPLLSMQNTRFVLSEVKSDISVGRVFLDDTINMFLSGKMDSTRAAMAKLWCTEMEGRVVDKCLQIFGGWGYMWEYPIARAYADARIHRLYAGSNEIMKELIARSI